MAFCQSAYQPSNTVQMPIESKPSLMTSLKRHRLLIAGVGLVAVVGGGFWVLDGGPSNAVARAEKPTTEADGAFRPSDTQWGSLKLTPVRQVSFRDERATDGKIALNEDTTTPVFSPYSGRVSRLIARPGDHVDAGAPLFAIEASEFVQGQNEFARLDATTRRLPVRAEITNPGRELLPEMFATFRIISGDARMGAAVPADAVIYEGAQARVWVARPDQKVVVSRSIEVGDTVTFQSPRGDEEFEVVALSYAEPETGG